MFTGLVAEKGALAARVPSRAGARLTIQVPASLVGAEMAELVLGESIAVNGVCLTVAALAEGGGFEADASPETLAKTTLGDLPVGGAVNLERALKVGDRLGGHLVAGHVDGVGSVTSRSNEGDALVLTFAVPPDLARFLAPKGSIVIDGVSLTVNSVKGAELAVMLIPVTQEKTSLSALGVGSKVNVEVDLIARYVAQLLDARNV